MPGNDLTRITYPSGRTVGYEYDAHDRLARVYDMETGLNYATAFDYHGSGALTGFTSGNGIPTAVMLDTNRYRVSTIDAGPLQLTYQYDGSGSGNVSAILDTNAPAWTRALPMTCWIGWRMPRGAEAVNPTAPPSTRTTRTGTGRPTARRRRTPSTIIPASRSTF